MTNIRIGAKVAINGERGTVTEIIKGLDGYTYARLAFEGDLATWGQYNNKFYRTTELTVVKK